MEKHFETTILTIEDGICILSLNRPQAMNALCDDINRDIYESVKIILEDKTARVLIITGKGKAFAAGADITEMINADQFGAVIKARDGHFVNDLFEALPIPVIAAINGACLGGGFEIALSCDFRIAGERAMFALPEVGLGIMPGAGGTQRLTKLIGSAKAKEMVMLGKTVRGKEACEIGIVNQCVPDAQVLDEAVNMAKELCKKPAASLRYAKAAVNFAVNNDIKTGNDYEKALFSLCFETEDQKEGMKAFLEKRPPNYINR